MVTCHAVCPSFVCQLFPLSTVCIPFISRFVSRLFFSGWPTLTVGTLSQINPPRDEGTLAICHPQIANSRGYPRDLSTARAPVWPPVPCGPCPRGATKVQNLFCFKLDAMSVPEALATTIQILLIFSIILPHQWGPRP